MTSQRELKSRWNHGPGKEIWARIHALDLAEPGHGHQSEDVYQLLDGLPFRDEVANGRDFRGIDFAAREIDMSSCNFQWADIGYFYFCKLDHSLFNGCTAERGTFENSLVSCSFVKARLRSCYFTDCDARDCNFTDARLRGCSFQNADLRGSRFINADCDSASFAGVNLLGCDFRGANLRECVFCDAIIDKTTDFRGATLMGVITEEWRDNEGNLRHHGVDLSKATL